MKVYRSLGIPISRRTAQEWLREVNIVSVAFSTIALVLCVLFIVVQLANSDVFYNRNVLQAKAWLHGQLEIYDTSQPASDQLFSWIDPQDSKDVLDLAEHEGKLYHTLAPLPSIFFTPIVGWVHVLGIDDWFPDVYAFMQPGFMAIGLCILPVLLFFLLQRASKLGINHRIFLVVVFLFGSNTAYLFLYTGDWYFHTLVTLCLQIGSIIEFYGKRRYWFIGVLLGGILLTRPTAVGILLFFLFIMIAEQWRFSSSGEEKQIMAQVKKMVYSLWRPILAVILPLICAVLLSGVYNIVRFDALSDNGYARAKVLPEHIRVQQQEALFHPKYMITNIYWYFIASPIPHFQENSWQLKYPYFTSSSIGMNFFITAPLFLLIFFHPPHSRQAIAAWIASGAILCTLLSFYATGYVQYGPRYIADLLPLWLLLLAWYYEERQLKQIPWNHLVILFLSIIVNVYFVVMSF